MERRFIILILSLSLIWLSWGALQIYLASKRPLPAEKGADEAIAQADAAQKQNPDERPAADEAKPAEAKAAEAAEKPDAAGRAVQPQAPAVARQFLTLGSADPHSGYRIFFGGKDVVAGGTSAVAPLYGALTALLNQARERAKMPPLGFINPISRSPNMKRVSLVSTTWIDTTSDSRRSVS